MEAVHVPVMWKEALEYLVPVSEGPLMVDATCGEGGHSEIFLSRYPEMRIAAVDADSVILEVARARLEPFGSRIRFFPMWFNQFFRDYPPGEERPDLILFDLGISVFHYERSERGFSFQRNEALDMRLGGGLETSAFDVVNSYPEDEIADIVYTYGEERYSRRIARGICAARVDGPIATSAELARIIWDAVPPEYRRGRIHPATRSFQALRIFVNGELARLEGALVDAVEVLKPGGRIGVISFHSLEDRIVKRFFQAKSRACTCPPEQPICTCGGRKTLNIVTRKPLVPEEEEVRKNPPSRSAKFRVAEKVRDEGSEEAE